MNTRAAAMPMTKLEIRSNAKAWAVCLVASLFFFYEFIQMNMFNAISADLLSGFHMGAEGLSRMSAFYFVANVLFLFPAGAILDRCSARMVILVALATCVIGTALFACAHSEGWATVFRFITGIGSAFCFLSVIRLATRWFRASYLAMVVGLVVTIAMLGGVVAQKPLSLLVGAVGWREALFIDACLGALIFLSIFIVVQDYPPEFKQQHEKELQHISQLGYWRSLGMAFLKIQNWLGGTFTCLMNLPIIILGGLWGAEYLTKVHGIGAPQAPYITQMLFVGTIVGSPLVGWISDRLGLRRLPMLIGAVLALAFFIVLMLGHGLGFWSLLLLFFAIGLFTSAQVLGYPIVAENSLPAITAMSVSVVNISTQGGLAVFELIFGRLMGWHHRLSGEVSNAVLSGDFKWAMLMFPVGFGLAILAAIALRETYGKPRSNELR